MAGTVAQSKKAREKCLIRPSETGKWEVWTMGENGQDTRLAETCTLPSDAHVSPQSVMALPSRQLFAVPIWLSTPDPALMRDMVFLQLERRGFAGGRSSQDLIFDYHTVTSADNKTLALAVALPNSLPENLCVDLHRYEPLPRTFALPKDEFVIWREDGRLVLAVTRGSELAYFQTLGDSDLTESVLQELRCIKLQLEATNVTGQVHGVVLWGEFTPTDVSSVANALALPAKTGQRPPPALPPAPLDLVPAPVRELQRAAKKKERRKFFILLAISIYCLLVLLLAARVTWLYAESRILESRVNAGRPLVNEVMAASHRWNALDSAINPDSYPVELLLRCYHNLPPDGVRFTLFSVTGGKIFIQGEAKSAPAAFDFLEALKKNPDLADYKWQLPQPRVMANNNAEFQIEGLKYGAKTH